jgi:hypothetical protein
VSRPAAQLVQIAGTIPQGQTLRFRVMSQSRAGDDVEKLVRLTMRTGKTGPERLRAAGLTLSSLGGNLMVQRVVFGSQAAKYGLAAGDEVKSVVVPADRPNPYWFAIPALLALGVVIMLQRRRRQMGVLAPPELPA